MTMTLTKGQKIAGIVASLFVFGTGIANLVGTYRNLPTSVDEMKKDLRDLARRQSADHDLLIQVDTQVKTINHKLDLNAVGSNQGNKNEKAIRYQHAGVSNVYAWTDGWMHK